MTIPCPTCGGPVNGLLDTCAEPACLHADLDIDHAIAQKD